MPFAKLPELRLYYEKRGIGPRLLHLSGTQSDLRRRPNIFDSVLSDHFEILAFDPRGLGQSGCPEGPYSMAGYAADAAALLEQIGWNRCHVLGVSFGGMVAQELALRFPNRVERLVLIATSSGGAGGTSYPLHELIDLPLDEQARIWIERGDTFFNSDWQAANPSDFAAFRELAKANLSFRADEPEAKIGARLQLAARREHNTWDRLPELSCPVLVCGGERDGLAPVALQKALAERIPKARLEVFPGGHRFLAQDPRANQVVTDFLLES